MNLRAIIPLSIAFAIISGAAVAQVDTGCTRTRAGNPPREVFRCANGLVIEAEVAARIGLAVDATGPRDVKLDRGAVLVEVRPGSTFQILTPHAIASVRGTEFVVDVAEERTSVFVVEGEVAVTKRYLTDSRVTLQPGEGVDVERSEPLVVKTWGAARVDALLARFGR